ncbi:MAG: hypothetical protein A2W68_14600 [Betaproteobacteria bacterium RIFCSPLOWO2_02_64_14]|nr:MAG: hypothetical protein A2W68_14600 [Betaproteobacteria bacterium RIFCSPLOWO2_02_64_14]
MGEQKSTERRAALVTGASQGLGAAIALAIAPGATETPSRAAHLAENPAFREVIINRIPQHRLGRPEEMARAVCYLVSAQAAYVTGQTLVLDGGLTSY